jgi:hypothetical protein
VREVDQLEDAVDECVAERDEGVQGALRDSDQEDPEEGVRVLYEVDTEPGENDGDQQQPGALDEQRAEIAPRFYPRYLRLGDQIRLLEYDWGRASERPSPVGYTALLGGLGHPLTLRTTSYTGTPVLPLS